MSELEELKKKMHSASGAIQVLETFVRHVDITSGDNDLKELHAAAERGIIRLRENFEGAQRLLGKLSQRF